MDKLPWLGVDGGLDVSGDLGVVFELSEPWAMTSITAVESALTDFITAGLHGAYPSDGASPRASQLALAGPRATAGTSLSFPLSATAVDAGLPILAPHGRSARSGRGAGDAYRRA
jgi:hypothetical protein